MDWAMDWKGVLEMDLFDSEMARYVEGQFKSDPSNIIWPGRLRLMTLTRGFPRYIKTGYRFVLT